MEINEHAVMLYDDTFPPNSDEPDVEEGILSKARNQLFLPVLNGESENRKSDYTANPTTPL